MPTGQRPRVAPRTPGKAVYSKGCVYRFAYPCKSPYLLFSQTALSLLQRQSRVVFYFESETHPWRVAHSFPVMARLCFTNLCCLSRLQPYLSLMGGAKAFVLKPPTELYILQHFSSYGVMPNVLLIMLPLGTERKRSLPCRASLGLCEVYSDIQVVI